MVIKELIQRSFEAARTQPVEARTKRSLHQRRSRLWVETLADSFRHHFAGDAAVRVFSKHNPLNRRDFGLNELLYDIVVCRVGTVESARRKKVLLYVRDVLWQVESEFARDSRQALIDFNKLVLGAAQNKLFIGPRIRDTGGLLEVLLPAASACSGKLFVSLIPHPGSWGTVEASVEVWAFAEGKWVPL